MLKYNYKSILSRTPAGANAYDFVGKDGKRITGSNYQAQLTVHGEDASMAFVTIKGKTIDAVNAALVAYADGKPGSIVSINAVAYDFKKRSFDIICKL